MERLRPRDEEWASVVRQRRDSDFWVSGRGLMSERGEIESEITREAVGRELQSSKQRVLHKFFLFIIFTIILAWFKAVFSLIQPFLACFSQFRPSTNTIQFGPNQHESTRVGRNLKTRGKKKNQRGTNTRSATSRTAHGAVSGTGAAALEPHSCFLAYQMQHCKLYGFFVS